MTVFAVIYRPIGHATGTLELRVMSVSRCDPRGRESRLHRGLPSAAVGDERLLMEFGGIWGNVCLASYPDRRQQIVPGGTNGSAKEGRSRGCHRLAVGQ